MGNNTTRPWQSGSIGSATPFYVMATDCGHSVWTSDKGYQGGITFCPNCGRYVGVIVTRKERK